MKPEEKKEVKVLLKTLNKLKKGELNVMIENLHGGGINKICEIFHNILYNNIKPRNKLSLKKLMKLMKKNRAKVEFLSIYSPSKKALMQKKKVLQSGGFPLASIFKLIAPSILSLFR